MTVHSTSMLKESGDSWVVCLNLGKASQSRRGNLPPRKHHALSFQSKKVNKGGQDQNTFWKFVVLVY